VVGSGWQSVFGIDLEARVGEDDDEIANFFFAKE